jgi:pilus assembly protein CpaC
VAGGEFPFPTLQGGGGGVGQITISFKEFGVRLHFLPTITPRGTIRLHVTPEVSSLDYANSLTISGATVPALDTRRVETEVELQSGQSFAIAGLLDNRTTESLSKIPGLANIPLLGKLFTSRSTSKSNSELLVIVTPELVEPISEGQTLPDLPRPQSFMQGPGILNQPPRTPGIDKTGAGPARPVRSEIPVQEMEQLQRADQPAQSSGAPNTAPATPLFNPAMAQPLPVGGPGVSTGAPPNTTPSGASVRNR